MMKNRATVIIIISSLTILLCIIYYSVMLHDTDNLLTDFADCIKGNYVSNAIINTELYKYYNRNELYNNEISDADINIRRVLVLHNFHKGIMFIKYDCETFNKSGEHIYGSANVYAKWYIEKKNGVWTVVDVIEKP